MKDRCGGEGSGCLCDAEPLEESEAKQCGFGRSEMLAEDAQVMQKMGVCWR